MVRQADYCDHSPSVWRGAPVHARFNWSPGGLSVAVPGADGQQLDLSTAADALEQQVLIQGGPATLPPQPVHALGLDDEATLNIRELVLDASLPLGGVDQWTRANTDRALGELHGRLVLPGQTFSLLDALGTLNEGRGYRSAPDDASVIARGVNLVATSLAQVVFWTGYGIEERQAPAHGPFGQASHRAASQALTRQWTRRRTETSDSHENTSSRY